VKVAIDQVYVSNKGRGPMRARVESIKDGRAVLLRLDTKRARIRYIVPVHFFLSPSCGWRLAKTSEVRG